MNLTPTGKISFIAASAVALCFAGASSAQDGNGGEDMFKLSVSIFVETDNNRDGIGDLPAHLERPYRDTDRYAPKKEDAFDWGITPRVDFYYRMSQSADFKAHYAPTIIWHDNPRVGDPATEWSHDLMGTLGVAEDKHYSLQLQDHFKYIQDKDLYKGSEWTPLDPTDNPLDDENSHTDNRLSASVAYFISERTFIEAEGKYRYKKYDDDDFSIHSDETDWSGAIYLGRQFSQAWSLSLMGVYTWSDEETPDNFPYDKKVSTYTLGLSTVYRTSETLFIRASLGYEWVDYAEETFKDQECPTDFNLEVNYKVSARVGTGLGVRYGITDSYNYPYTSQDLTSIYGFVNWRITDKLFATGRIDYRRAEYEREYAAEDTSLAAINHYGDGDEDVIYVRVCLDYDVTDSIRLGAYVIYEDVDSDIGYSYDRTKFGAKATYTF